MLHVDANYSDAVHAVINYYSKSRSNIKILIEPKDVTCHIGSYVNILATVEATNPSFQWYNQLGKPIPMKTASNLYFNSVQTGDFGFYRLQIIDSITGRKVLTSWVEIKRSVIGTETIKPPSSLKPVLLSSSPGGSYRIGSTFTLTACFRNATAYQWYKDGKRLERCTCNSIMVHNANTSNSGVYVLAATNSPCSGLMELTKAMEVSVTELQ